MISKHQSKDLTPDFFKKLSVEADDEQIKRLAKFLQNWEASHVNFLKSQLEYMRRA